MEKKTIQEWTEWAENLDTDSTWTDQSQWDIELVRVEDVKKFLNLRGENGTTNNGSDLILELSQSSEEQVDDLTPSLIKKEVVPKSINAQSSGSSVAKCPQEPSDIRHETAEVESLEDSGYGSNTIIPKGERPSVPDLLICPECKGEQFIYHTDTSPDEICPECNGSGIKED